jgi:hypothetical protein
VALPATSYEPRCPAHSARYQIVRDPFETFHAHAARLRDGEGLPRFVEEAAFAHRAPACHAEALAEAGVPELSAVRLARRRVRAVSLRRLRPRPAGPLFVQEPRGLSQLRCPPDGGARRHTPTEAFALDHASARGILGA